MSFNLVFIKRAVRYPCHAGYLGIYGGARALAKKMLESVRETVL